MNSEFKKREGTFLLLLILFTALLFAIHGYVSYNFISKKEFTISLYAIYSFHFFTVLIVYTLINYKYSSGKKEIFPLFMGATLFKMILCIVFLLPVLLKPNENATFEVLNFFIPYFLFLAFEIVTITQLLKEE